MNREVKLTGSRLTVNDVKRISCDMWTVSVPDEVMSRLIEGRKLVFELSARGVPIYGCNRGVGWNKDKKVTKESITRFNDNMLHSHSVAVGNYATVEEVRVTIAILNARTSFCVLADYWV